MFLLRDLSQLERPGSRKKQRITQIFCTFSFFGHTSITHTTHLCQQQLYEKPELLALKDVLRSALALGSLRVVLLQFALRLAR
jgi:hypothetical protein